MPAISFAQKPPNAPALASPRREPWIGAGGPQALEFDVPANATSAALWFLDSSDCAGNHWDQNYRYPVSGQ